jgi:CxxC motif-containing protein (DUF1111 family)
MVIAACLLVSACGASAPPDAPVAAFPGAPLPGLSEDERARFHAGLALFQHTFSPEEGLGPFFNENQCSACHTFPASGGTGEQLAIRATIFDEATGHCDLLPEFNGENVQTNATPLLRERGITRRPVPDHATHLSRFNSPFLFGMGLVDAIPDEALEALAAHGAGRLGRDAEGRIARFGRKAEHATLESFVASALLHEMGLTTPVHPAELPFNGMPLPPELDPAANPEIDAGRLARLVDFVRFLAPLPRLAPADPADQPLIERGARTFQQIGCAECHVPYHETGRHESPALDRKRIYLYSDLLLHDMGAERAGACGIAASTRELRTEPLMGLGYRRMFLHDFSATSIPEAIEAHGGQAGGARDAYRGLDELEREYLIRFLRTL